MSDVAIGIVAFVAIATLCALIWHRVWRRKYLPSIGAAISTAVIVMALSYASSGALTPFAIPIFVTLTGAAFVIALAWEFVVARKRTTPGASDSAAEEPPWRGDLRRLSLDLLAGIVFTVVLLYLGQALKSGDILLGCLLVIASYFVVRARQYFAERYPNPKHGVEVQRAED